VVKKLAVLKGSERHCICHRDSRKFDGLDSFSTVVGGEDKQWEVNKVK
jgi:hypothetical protein